MTQYERVKQYIIWFQNQYTDKDGKTPIPIFEIVLFEHPDKELIYHKPNGDIRSGYPDMGSENRMGFYYELETAIRAMNENWADIQETVFHAGFVLCRFPGLYSSVIDEARIYFVWDEDRQGFFESPEPEIFRHVAF